MPKIALIHFFWSIQASQFEAGYQRHFHSKSIGLSPGAQFQTCEEALRMLFALWF